MAGNALVAKTLTLGAYAPLSTTTKVATGTLYVSGTAATAYILGDDGLTDVPIPKNVPLPFSGVDLSTIQLKGTSPDLAIIVGAGSGRQ
jgi:hypothetical protein